MERPSPSSDLDHELDLIIISEISYRFDPARKQPNADQVFEILEEKNRQIVEAHQMGTVHRILPSLFTAYLQTRPGGKLHLDENRLNAREINLFTEKKGRFEVLLGASINALQDPHIKQLVQIKETLFRDSVQRADIIMELIDQVGEIRNDVQLSGSDKWHDESSAVAYLKQLSDKRIQLQNIRSRYIQLKTDPFLAEPLQQLHHAIHQMEREMESHSRSAVKFVFDRASAVFHQYRRTRSELKNLRLFMAQKEELTSYYELFENLEDTNRCEKISRFMTSIDETIDLIQKKIEKEKQAEQRLTQQNIRKINDVYEAFLAIKQEFEAGRLSKRRQQRRALKKLNTYCDVLKANGQRVKAREIERFLNTTGLIQSDKKTDMEILRQKYLFYRNAFLTLIPITLMLAAVAIYQFFRG